MLFCMLRIELVYTKKLLIIQYFFMMIILTVGVVLEVGVIG